MPIITFPYYNAHYYVSMYYNAHYYVSILQCSVLRFHITMLIITFLYYNAHYYVSILQCSLLRFHITMLSITFPYAHYYVHITCITLLRSSSYDISFFFLFRLIRQFISKLSRTEASRYRYCRVEKQNWGMFILILNIALLKDIMGGGHFWLADNSDLRTKMFVR